MSGLIPGDIVMYRPRKDTFGQTTGSRNGQAANKGRPCRITSFNAAVGQKIKLDKERWLPVQHSSGQIPIADDGVGRQHNPAVVTHDTNVQPPDGLPPLVPGYIWVGRDEEHVPSGVARYLISNRPYIMIDENNLASMRSDVRGNRCSEGKARGCMYEEYLYLGGFYRVKESLRKEAVLKLRKHKRLSCKQNMEPPPSNYRIACQNERAKAGLRDPFHSHSSAVVHIWRRDLRRSIRALKTRVRMHFPSLLPHTPLTARRLSHHWSPVYCYTLASITSSRLWLLYVAYEDRAHHKNKVTYVYHKQFPKDFCRLEGLYTAATRPSPVINFRTAYPWGTAAWSGAARESA
ncbi:hypothetical protein HYDPIDRAFT_167707 [Hydnomerulius pinastri MD-312]|uniref:Uncharacterized protein n=1 Tax=Hydnomerulius pinastri MD-312 TaxID=994086 RepID=A0A0C9WFL9_9AGAM|nr:hypothetical protein HYDPIDRAFT_167707 [Hydnomerulius pinastri MD-312]